MPALLLLSIFTPDHHSLKVAAQLLRNVDVEGDIKNGDKHLISLYKMEERSLGGGGGVEGWTGRQVREWMRSLQMSLDMRGMPLDKYSETWKGVTPSVPGSIIPFFRICGLPRWMTVDCVCRAQYEGNLDEVVSTQSQG